VRLKPPQILCHVFSCRQKSADFNRRSHLVSEGYPEQFGGPYKSMEKDTGALIVYTVE
jgi:hypothetical protein